MRRIIFLWHILILPLLGASQNCGLPDTVFLAPNSIDTVSLNLTGYANDMLSNPGQGVCGIAIEFAHQYVEYLEVILVSPNGDAVTLIGPNIITGAQPTFFASWDIRFVQNGATAVPDPGFNQRWSNTQSAKFVNGGIYRGSYYPYNGQLEDFNAGPVNGTWQLILRNDPTLIPARGAIVDFRIAFCDDSGTECCFADSGQIVNEPDRIACEGDESLLFQVNPFYFGIPPDTSQFGYQLVIAREGVLYRYDTLVDLRADSAATYRICGLSYELSDLDSIPAPDGQLTLDSLRADLESPVPSFCGELTSNCIEIQIFAPPDTAFLSEVICEGDSIQV
ncbi:MAG: hypothetical protein R3350_05350, partial [Saprospiraceae bacterium]|nr:hypothetical protein [Saprospiraceae bacterium]